VIELLHRTLFSYVAARIAIANIIATPIFDRCPVIFFAYA
jgi:hypothetical protein